MSQLNNIVGNTQAAVITTEVLTPVSNNQSAKIVEFEDDTSAIAKSLRARASFSLRPAKGDTRRKVITKVAIPFQPAAIDGVLPPIVAVERIITDLVPESATSTETDALEDLSAQVSTDAMKVDLVINGRFPY